MLQLHHGSSVPLAMATEWRTVGAKGEVRQCPGCRWKCSRHKDGEWPGWDHFECRRLPYSCARGQADYEAAIAKAKQKQKEKKEKEEQKKNEEEEAKKAESESKPPAR